MVIRRRDIRPSTACKGSEYAHESDKFWKRRIRPSSEEVPQPDQGKSRSWQFVSLTLMQELPPTYLM
jgi:hypothetical protein